MEKAYKRLVLIIKIGISLVMSFCLFILIAGVILLPISEINSVYVDVWLTIAFIFVLVLIILIQIWMIWFILREEI